MKVLAINPGSTSTKVGLFEDGKLLWDHTDRFDSDVIGKFATIADQKDFRREGIEKIMADHGVALSDVDAFVGRGGLLRPMLSGTYDVNDAMLDDLKSDRYGRHAANLGGQLAKDLAAKGGCNRAYIVDPVVVDEMMDVARITGLPDVPRRSVFHALNQKAICRRAAADMGKRFDQCRMIVAHMGGGITVGAHENGRVIDVSNGLGGEGPFSPERAGGLPSGPLIDLAMSGQYTRAQLAKMIAGKGGLVAHLDTNDLREVERRIASGDKKAQAVYEAMAYNVAKEIGARAVALNGQVDAVVLTGGLAHSAKFCDLIVSRVSFIAPVKIYPGEDELQALADGAFRVLKGEETAKTYGA